MCPNSLAELDRAHLIRPTISLACHEIRGSTVLRSARRASDDEGETANLCGLHEHLARIGYQRGLIFRALADDVIGLAVPLRITEAEAV